MNYPSPLEAVPVGERPHVALVELREVRDEAVVEEMHVIDTAGGDQLLKQRQFDAVNARIGHRFSYIGGVKENGRAKWHPTAAALATAKLQEIRGVRQVGGVRVRRLTQKSEAVTGPDFSAYPQPPPMFTCASDD